MWPAHLAYHYRYIYMCRRVMLLLLAPLITLQFLLKELDGVERWFNLSPSWELTYIYIVWHRTRASKWSPWTRQALLSLHAPKPPGSAYHRIVQSRPPYYSLPFVSFGKVHGKQRPRETVALATAVYNLCLMNVDGVPVDARSWSLR